MIACPGFTIIQIIGMQLTRTKVQKGVVWGSHGLLSFFERCMMIIIVYMTVFVVTLLSLQFCSVRDEDVYVAFCELFLGVMLKIDVCF